MKSHLNFLGVLFVVWGGLSMLVGGMSLILAAAAALITPPAVVEGPRVSLAAYVTTATFGVFGFATFIWGAAHAANGMGLRRRRARSRLTALALGAANLLLLPFGTALGTYALWVLLHEEARRLLNEP